MSRTSLFGSPLFLGFEEFERAFERLSKSATDGYPPYNVEQHSETHLRIYLAVAGFSADELSVQMERNQLVIRGKQAPEAERKILYRGIATRQFQRSFVLAEGIEVTGAMLENGLLRIDLDRPLVEPEVRKIEITTGP
jgi:HSP20 family molecular chaperone IbpA